MPHYTNDDMDWATRKLAQVLQQAVEAPIHAQYVEPTPAQLDAAIRQAYLMLAVERLFMRPPSPPQS